MELTKLAAAIKELGRPKYGFGLCIYGPPKSGKTRLAITICKVPQVSRVFMIDIENGHETILTMYRMGLITEEEAKKINIINVQDTPDRPLGGETVLKLLTVQQLQVVCDEHGRVNCGDKSCQGPDKKPTGTPFNITTLGHNDVVIIDSGTALTNSILNYHLRGKPRDYKPGWEEFGPLARDLSNILTIIQACKTNFILVTHQLAVDRDVTVIREGKSVTVKTEDVYPLIGTKPFAMNCAKYFSHVLYMHLEGGRHKGGSSTTYRYRTVTGSRGGWQIEKLKEPSLASIFDQLYKQEPIEDIDDSSKAGEQPTNTEI